MKRPHKRGFFFGFKEVNLTDCLFMADLIYSDVEIYALVH